MPLTMVWTAPVRLPAKLAVWLPVTTPGMVLVKARTSRFARGRLLTLYSGRTPPTDEDDASRFSAAILTSTDVDTAPTCIVKLNRACSEKLRVNALATCV